MPKSTGREHAEEFGELLTRLEARTEWKLGFPLRQAAPCYHGGAFFKAIGESFDQLERRDSVINADVLDAWFPPAPEVLDSLHEHLPWLLRTSPPTGCEGLLQTISERRGVKIENLLAGAGSSDLIFRAMRQWLDQHSQVLMLDPTYGEYRHVLEQVVGCRVEAFPLDWDRDYEIDLAAFGVALERGFDLVILVNPNSPTGRHIPRDRLVQALRRAPLQTRIWVDETYVEYRGSDQSVESFAAESENVTVCKSMSKVYALSGARVAYLCAGAHQLEALRAITPTWVVGLPSQLAAVRALENPDYYAMRYAETHRLREELADALRALGWKVLPGVANFLLCHLPTPGPTADELVDRCRRHGLFLRNTNSMGSATTLDHEVRIAVKSAADNARMVEILRSLR